MEIPKQKNETGVIDMEKQKENIQPLNEEELEQASGGAGTPDPKDGNNQEDTHRPSTAKPRFI